MSMWQPSPQAAQEPIVRFHQRSPVDGETLKDVFNSTPSTAFTENISQPWG